MNIVDLAWAAGLFEGEGCASRTQHKVTNRVYIYLSLYSTDLDTIMRFHRVIGCLGTVRIHNRGRHAQPHHKTTFVWSSSGKDALCLLMHPGFVGLLGDRRSRRVSEIVRELMGQPKPWSIRLCKTHCARGHPYTAENVRVDLYGYRTCRTCNTSAQSARSRRRRKDHREQMVGRTIIGHDGTEFTVRGIWPDGAPAHEQILTLEREDGTTFRRNIRGLRWPVAS